MKRGNLILLLFAFLGVVSCNNKEAETKSEATTRVKVMKVTSGEISQTQGYSGTIEEMKSSILSFATMGTIQNILVVPGQKVRKGQLVAVLDATNTRNTYNIAKATLTQAEDAYGRMKLLYDNKSLPEIRWKEVESQLSQARSTEKIAKKQLADCNLYAPFSGVIAEKNAEVGQNIAMGLPVARLVAIENVKVKIAVPENEVLAVKIGQKVSVFVEALGNKIYEGVIKEKGAVANPMSRSYDVKALLNNPSGELMPGMICEVNLQKEAKQTGLFLPSRLIQLDNQNRNFVWIVQNGKAKKSYVKTGILSDKGVAILSGLSEKDEVICEGQQKVSESVEVSILR